MDLEVLNCANEKDCSYCPPIPRSYLFKRPLFIPFSTQLISPGCILDLDCPSGSVCRRLVLSLVLLGGARTANYWGPGGGFVVIEGVPLKGDGRTRPFFLSFVSSL